MKTKALLIFLVATLFAAGFVNAQINVDCNGNVGIGTSPSYKLDVSGAVRVNPGSGQSIYIDNSGYSSSPSIWGVGTFCKTNQLCHTVYSYYFSSVSDERVKENISDIENSLDLILKLNGKRYDYKTNLNDSEQLKKIKRNHAGYLAQEVVKIIPEAVQYDDSTDLYSIDYTKFIPFITEAIKEQQQVIENLQTEILELKASLGSTNTLKSATLVTDATDIQANGVNELYQNAPNPFSQSTTIGYSLTEDVQKAMICIYDMNGAQLKCIPLDIEAHGNITITGNEFKAGMYMYSLIVDGQLIDTKRMVLTN